MPLNLHHLRTFAVVVRTGRVGIAARDLGVTQPAVSRSIRELEAQLGIRLLERRADGVVPTAAGRELYDHASAISALEREAEEAMGAVRGLDRGTLHVAASTTIATYVLPRVIGLFKRAHPGIEFRLSAVHTRILVPMVRHYLVDLAFAEAPVSDRRLNVRRWIMDEMVLITAPDHPFARRLGEGDTILPSDLEGELLVLREPESGTRDLVLRGLAAAGVIPTHTMAVDGTEVIKHLVAEGLGVAIVSHFAVADQVALGRLVVVPVAGLRITRPFNRLRVVGRKAAPSARAFQKLLSAEAERRGALDGVSSVG